MLKVLVSCMVLVARSDVVGKVADVGDNVLLSDESDRRRLLDPATWAALFAIGGTLITTTSAVIADTKRRRLQTGEMVDTVCEKSMSLIETETIDTFVDLLKHFDANNEGDFSKVTSKVSQACNDAGIPQCTLYVSLMHSLDAEGVLMKGAWVDAFGDLREKQTACSTVVNYVNEHMSAHRRIEVDAETDIEMRDGMFVAIKKNQGVARRLLGLATTGAAATGVILGHMCKSFVNGPMPLVAA